MDRYPDRRQQRGRSDRHHDNRGRGNHNGDRGRDDRPRDDQQAFRDRGSSRGRGDQGLRGMGRNRGNGGPSSSGFENRVQIQPGFGVVPLRANYIEFKTIHGLMINIYKVKWGPTIHNTDTEMKMLALKSIWSELSAIFGKPCYFQNFITSTKKVDDLLSFETIIQDISHTIQLELYKSLSLDDLGGVEVSAEDNFQILNFYNTFAKHFLRQKDYQQIGRFQKFFQSQDQQEVQGLSNQNRCNMWPGYHLNIFSCESSRIFLNVDACTKFVTQRTIMQEYQDRIQSGEHSNSILDEFDSSNKNIPRKTVITSHNSKSYQIDGATIDITPETCLISINGVETTMYDYFEKKYKIILDKKQPLLFVNKNPRIYLPSQLCNEANLPKNFTRNTMDQQILQGYKLNKAQKRFEKIEKLVSLFANDKVFEEWGISIGKGLIEVHGDKLPEPMAQDLDGNTTTTFKDLERSALLSPAQLYRKEMMFVYEKRNFETAKQVLQSFDKASGRLGIKFIGHIDDLNYVEVPENQEIVDQLQLTQGTDLSNGQNFITCIDASLNQFETEQKFAFILISKESEKPQIKRYLDKMGIPSQFLTLKNTIKNLSKLGVISNTLRQVNAKLGLDNYRLSLPRHIIQTNTMFVGIDMCQQGRKTIIGMAATQSTTVTQYFTKVAVQELCKEDQVHPQRKQKEILCEVGSQILQDFMVKAIQNFKDKNQGNLPGQIIVYRGGVGDPITKDQSLRLEGPDSALWINVRSRIQEGYNPKILMIFVNKRHQTRLFQINNSAAQSQNYDNPDKGTVVNKLIVQHEGTKLFDFFLISNENRIATALPIHYDVVVNTTALGYQEVSLLTYHLCYNYYGYAGPVKIPAPMMYAYKLAYYYHDNGFVSEARSEHNSNFGTGGVNDRLSHCLHFL